MASKDYVKRGSGTRKKTTKPSPSRKSASKSRLTSGFFAVIVIAAFGYGLHFLNSQPESAAEKKMAKPLTQKSTPHVEGKTPAETSKPLPKPPTQKWEYVDELKNRKIEVTPKELKTPEIPYIMQCGAYKKRAQAEKRKVEIAFQGLNSNIRKLPNSDWYRVVLGPYKHRREADRDKYKLQRAKIEPCAIWKAR